MPNTVTDEVVKQFINAKRELEAKTGELETALSKCYADQQSHLNGKAVKLFEPK